ncbi:exonuclease SbcCD subunit D [Rhodopseudomonas pseudopalustris]|uniref:Nuclease SbcCD subunit D n=1 Tax=Rhodopseudomonas pseudopalustris TaxID=1513892 RepID=A0A1H8XB01_9BRAD|nr:exonuclease SbcCD subunit D [Rhodopseudomonas pseudopalustris]SEP36971.1 Exodeoxyribonuclease I subunit D [Rhodopseudomonas pseudopalustris]
MRILHTADLHLGRAFNNMSLEDDHRAILDQILECIILQRVDVLVIAGDIFDRAVPPASAVRQFNTFLTQVANQTNAAVVMIAGNHDSGDRIGSMAIMTDTNRALIRGPLNVEEAPLIVNDSHGPVAISALPFSHEYAARECFGNESINTPEDVVTAQITSARRHLPDGARWVVVAHAFVAGAKGSEGERPLARVGGLETVRPEVFDGAHYVALGHLHRPQSIRTEHIRYAGAPLAFGFDEAGEPKSMALVDLWPDGTTTISTIPFVPPRTIRIVRGKLADLVLAEPSSDFIKVILTDEKPLIDPMKRLREVFSNACGLIYARDEQISTVNATLPPLARINDPIQVVGDFLEHVRNERLADAELALVDSAFDDLQKLEDRA